ncbi:MAG: hypothetical protein GC171_02585 [Terrimonas sp.]|nr:hypothetical protein [Terrimonas sp.]
MYITPITRMVCVLDGYLEIINSYQRNLVMDINQDFHLENTESGIYVRRNPESLHNLKSEPGKARQIVAHMKNTLRGGCGGKNNIDSLETLLKQHASYFYQNDSDSFLFAESVVCRMIELAADDSQFSEFSYF